MKLHKKKPILKQKKVVIPIVLLAFLLVARMVVPSLILTRANKYLAEFSPVITGHINDIDLSVIRGASRAEGITVKLKHPNKTVMNLKQLEISLAWRELLKGKILMDMSAEGAEVKMSKQILSQLKKIAKKGKKANKELPVDLERFDVKDSKITFEDYKGFKKGEKLTVTNINSRVTNLTPKNSYPYSFYNLTASIQGEAPIKAAGKINLKVKPIEWDVDGTLSAFNLPTANQFLKNKVPLTFTKGHLDVFAEASSEHGKINGYVKPFFKDLDIVKNGEDFKGPKHWAVEIFTAVGNLILKNAHSDSVATRIPFKFDKGLKVDTGEALQKAIQNGHEENLKPGIENKYDIE